MFPEQQAPKASSKQPQALLPLGLGDTVAHCGGIVQWGYGGGVHLDLCTPWAQFSFEPQQRPVPLFLQSMAPSATDSNVTAVTGDRRLRSLAKVALITAAIAVGANLWRSSTLAVCAYAPSLLMAYTVQKPKTGPQLACTLLMWAVWSVYGAAVVAVGSLGMVYWSWGSLVPFIALCSVFSRKVPYMADQWWQVSVCGVRSWAGC